MRKNNMMEVSKVTIKCAWCGRVIRTVDKTDGEETLVSHGICKTCSSLVLSGMYELEPEAEAQVP
jgi:hypothetical protein